LLHSWGLEVVIGSTIGLDNNQLVGTDEQRTADFQQQLDNPNIKAIWCVKGGYGTVRIIDSPDFTNFKQHPKWIVGFSDITVLHNHLNTMGYKTLHAVMPITVPRATKRRLIETPQLWSPAYDIPTALMNKIGKATGELVGGNLSLYSL
jgi:muramoyltetrapeptide carboxypeptidase